MDKAVAVLLTKHRERDAREDAGQVVARVRQIDTLRAASKKVKAWLDEHPQDRLGPNGMATCRLGTTRTCPGLSELLS